KVRIRHPVRPDHAKAVIALGAEVHPPRIRQRRRRHEKHLLRPDEGEMLVFDPVIELGHRGLPLSASPLWAPAIRRLQHYASSNGSSPASRSAGVRSLGTRGFTSFIASATCRM